MKKKNVKTRLLPKDMKKIYDEYGRTRTIYEEYQRIRKQLGKKSSEIMNIEEIEENLKSLGAKKYT